MKTNYTLIGDVREKLKELPDKSIQMCVTSPPYYALRDYGTAKWEGGDPNCDHLEKTSGMSNKNTLGHSGNLPNTNQANLSGKIQYKNKCKKCGAKRKDNQLGLEDTPEEFVENMVEVFAQVHRVLRDDGTLWLNLGDSYSSGSRTSTTNQSLRKDKDYGVTRPPANKNIKPKSLLGIPWKVAIALQEWGWILRQDIIWAKKNCMPESVKDRFTKNHEYIFLLSKQPKYFFNQILEDAVSGKDMGILRCKKQAKLNHPSITKRQKMNINPKTAGTGKKNKRSVWNMRTASYKEAHFAVFPPELAETCIKAGSNEKDIVLDCFMGSGTTAMVAQQHSRKWIGVELNPEYEKLIKKRTAQRELF